MHEDVENSREFKRQEIITSGFSGEVIKILQNIYFVSLRRH